jgi:hypothetical protein
VGLRNLKGGTPDVSTSHLANDLIRSIKEFRELDLGMLEAEVLARLVDGRRTSNELVLEIYGLGKDRSDYIADYSRVRRALKNLERRGFVSAPLFSKEKPYRLTQHGIASLTRIGGTQWPKPRIVPVKDRVLYACSLLLAVATVLAAREPFLSHPLDSYLAGIFLVSIGASLVRLIETIRRIS